MSIGIVSAAYISAAVLFILSLGGHADNAIPDGAFGAFLTGKPAEAKDEKNSRNHIGCRCETVIHSLGLLMISGTWQACAG